MTVARRVVAGIAIVAAVLVWLLMRPEGGSSVTDRVASIQSDTNASTDSALLLVIAQQGDREAAASERTTTLALVALLAAAILLCFPRNDNPRTMSTEAASFPPQGIRLQQPNGTENQRMRWPEDEQRGEPRFD